MIPAQLTLFPGGQVIRFPISSGQRRWFLWVKDRECWAEITARQTRYFIDGRPVLPEVERGFQWLGVTGAGPSGAISRLGFHLVKTDRHGSVVKAFGLTAEERGRLEDLEALTSPTRNQAAEARALCAQAYPDRSMIRRLVFDLQRERAAIDGRGPIRQVLRFAGFDTEEFSVSPQRSSAARSAQVLSISKKGSSPQSA